jgi:hypothetical protein
LTNIIKIIQSILKQFVTKEFSKKISEINEQETKLLNDPKEIKILTTSEAKSRIKTLQKALKASLLESAYPDKAKAEGAWKTARKMINPVANTLLSPLIAVKAVKKFTIQTDKEKAIEVLFKKKQIEVRNEQPWAPITALVTTKKHDNSKVSNQTIITPASNFMKIEGKDEEGRSILLGGICSSNNENRDHAVNLAVDVLYAPNQKEKPLLITVRGGIDVLPSHEETLGDNGKVSKITLNEEEIKVGFDKRFDEGLVACLGAKYGLENLSTNIPTNSKDHPIELDIADIGFLSQCKKEEIEMQTKQFEFLDIMHEQPREVTYTNLEGKSNTVWVKPKILSFNFGVEWGDRGAYGEKNLPDNWSKKNNKNLDLLYKKTNQWIQDHSGQGQENRIIDRLRQQIKTMSDEGELYNNSEDYYAVAARVILLSYNIGIIPKIHCKSGKDRTSRAIEAAKALAIEIQNSSDGETLPLWKTTTQEQIELRENVGLNSGNQDIQECNTDFRGNKQYSAMGFKEGISFIEMQAGYSTLVIKEDMGLGSLAKR